MGGGKPAGDRSEPRVIGLGDDRVQPVVTSPVFAMPLFQAPDPAAAVPRRRRAASRPAGPPRPVAEDEDEGLLATATPEDTDEDLVDGLVDSDGEGLDDDAAEEGGEIGRRRRRRRGGRGRRGRTRGEDEPDPEEDEPADAEDTNNLDDEPETDDRRRG